MPDTLSFRFRFKRGAAFTLDVEERIPLQGITAISGPSGSGKTTLLRALAGLDADEPGTRATRFAGKPWDDDRVIVPPEERRIGMVFQEPALFPHLSVARNIGYGARRRQIKSTEAIVDALDLGALMSREVIGLSGGEARRVALARALASDPALLLLDEPMSGLDDKRKADFLPYVARAVTAARVPTIYVSHSSDEITTLADRVLLLGEGRSLGWQTPPMRLSAQVTGRSAGGMAVRIGTTGEGDADFSLPVRAFVGERLGLGLPPDAVLVSSAHPGAGTALVTLPVDSLLTADEFGRPGITVRGQTLRLPPSLTPPAEATKLWLSILRVLPRPETSDSGI